MIEQFLISDEQLRVLSATRQGRVSIAGYNYQAAYAVARLVAMSARQPVLDLNDWPKRLRYDWGEDLDEACGDGIVIFTQCKRVATIGQPASLANVLTGFSPKWLWVPESERDRLRFRLVCSDSRFAAGGTTLGSLKSEVRTHFLTGLEEPAGLHSDRAVWIGDAGVVGHEVLFEALWGRFECFFLPEGVVDCEPAGPRLAAEKEALRVLLERAQIDASGQQQVLGRLRRLIHDNLITFDPANEAFTLLVGRGPRYLERADVNAAIDPWRPAKHRQPPFLLVDRTFLSEQREQKLQQFVARQPEWCDVAHGHNEIIKFIERDQTDAVEAAVLDKVVSRIGRSGKLPTLFVTGAPGEGKTTIARRVAARLVDAGKLLIADTGVGLHEPPGESDEYVQAIERLQEFGRPIVLLLDDPLYAESLWPEVLKKLNRPGLNIGALAASPQFLLDEHKSQLRMCDLSTFSMARSSRNERETLAALYERSVLSGSEEDFLVVAMEAAAGVPFSEIIDRLWLTLADGRDISSARKLSELPWQARAYLFVCFFSRAYEACPEPLLLKLLEITGGALDTSDVHTELQRMKHFAGWHIFRLSQRHRLAWTYQGAQITAAHAVIARQAWEQRPLPWCDIDDMMIQASVIVPEAIRDVSRLAIGLKSLSSASTMLDAASDDFTRSLIERWKHASNLQTRHICDLVSTFMTSGYAELIYPLRETLIKRAIPDSQGWLAAHLLAYMYYHLEKQRGFPPEVDVPMLIQVADFSIAPFRAVQFGNRLNDKKGLWTVKGNNELWDAFKARLLDALKGNLEWEVQSFLLTFLLAVMTPLELSPHISLVTAWLEKNTDDWNVRVQYLSLLSQHSTQFSDLRVDAARQTAKWLETHPDGSNVRVQYLTFLSKHRAQFFDLWVDAIRQTAMWLEEHSHDSQVRTVYLSLLSQHPAQFSDLWVDAARQTAKWLDEHSHDNHVRTVYLTFLSQHPAQFSDLWVDAARQTAKWLDEHSHDSHVRTVYLTFLSQHPAQFSDLWVGAARQTAKWLKTHVNEINILTKLLCLFPEIPYSQTGTDSVMRVDEWQQLASTALNSAVRVMMRLGLPIQYQPLFISFLLLHTELLRSLNLHDSVMVRKVLKLSHDITEEWFVKYPLSSMQYELPLP